MSISGASASESAEESASESASESESESESASCSAYCTFFSLARDRTAVIRTRAEPWGLIGVSARDAVRLQAGNATLRATLKLVNRLHKLGIPWILENPHTSKMRLSPRSLSWKAERESSALFWISVNMAPAGGRELGCWLAISVSKT